MTIKRGKVYSYVENDKIVVSIHITEDIDIEEIINDHNREVPKYERVEKYKVFNDSIDNRLKQ